MINGPMSLSDYELLEMLRDDGVQSFRGKEISTGRSLEVHLFLPFGRPENKAFFERLKALPLESRRNFLDVGTDGSTPYIVTDPLSQVNGFKEWAEKLFTPTQASVIPATPFAVPVSPRMQSSELDESVQILQAGQWRTGTPLPEGLITPPKRSSSPPPSVQPDLSPRNLPPQDLTMVFQSPFDLQSSLQKPADKPDDFTGLFHGPSASSTPVEAQPEPGEFTKLFNNPSKQTPAATPPPATRPPATPPPPPPNRGQESGANDFTDFFKSPMQPAALDQGFPDYGAEPPLPRTVAPPPTQRGSEFTQVFGESAFTPQPPPPPPLMGSSYGAGPSATGAFSGGAQFPPPPPPRSASGPSEYTRLMSGQSASAFAQPQAAPPPGAPALAGAKSNMPLFIALGVLVFLTILVVVYFLLSHR